MFRDRTNLFISYRRTFPRFGDSLMSTEPYPKNNNNNDTFLDDEIEMESYPMMNEDIDGGQEKDGKLKTDRLNTLPPLFVDIARDIDEYLHEIETLLEHLMKLYRKNSLPGFEDKTPDEQEIEKISLNILQLFQRSYNVIKKLEVIHMEQFLEGRQLNRGELIILDNMTKDYAQKIQWESNKFRVLQNNYLKFLNKDDLKPIIPKNAFDSSQLLLQEEEEKGKNGLSNEIDEYSMKTLQNQQQKAKNSNQKFLEQRDQEITELTKGIYEVGTIFREMQNLIIDQGTIIDRIDYNLENTVVELKQANKELEGATRYQKRTQKCKIILLLTLCVIALFFFVMLKPHNSTKTVKYEPNTNTNTGSLDEQNNEPEHQPASNNGAALLEDEMKIRII
ncbi:similar to Saccharomyces cerevisiae YOL018C TLG2 Syntaxin-like t-SNARE that forms a complex with Tlg1p and Vti1p and mediates fusion of endosome-derived vesicles with the late Golgi [Maudiozyma saulgeensis]|uniref:Similar to Saccharomyces cerevisiae YOL018C TLG2 Syntaxin-like t-SNARE that forms a complex with Tlg1p and Vti1p and mediates fusion of endosome-derived vesicles with the late Golgi n=1 Tax=Maudiozyma saulgeensis TaxID=1789683 RepID=A0A1X7R0J1_9SACH|nr:similar to Saccharomyces cerevisiae YOL018C TLG2 Syntaxin-like t-SNARE that forms a complex with Tlg1p and Vti1p and mediates fusion of endosome-derived vesicles with the late Golgi [Kazachstania saulgeensis]